MRIIPQLLVSALMLTSQVANALPQTATAQSQASAQTEGIHSSIVLNVASPKALEPLVKPADVEAEMLAPIRSYQAQQARIAAEKAAAEAKVKAAQLAAAKALRAKLATTSTTGKLTSYATGPLSSAQIEFLGKCESGMTWNRNSGNGFYGAFQFTIPTWNAMATGYDRADHAPLEVQITAVQKLLSRSSIYSQFPGCAKKMSAAGLI